MNVIINIENYEAFYLDFLEGNLNEEETRAFELFLEQHPDLKVDEELPNLSEELNSALDQDFLSSMKMFDVTENITENNCEQFMIASVEEILPAAKKIELNDFLAKRNDLRSEFAFYEKTKLVADLNVIYTEKSSLKKGFVIPMYAKYVAVAASLIMVFLFFPTTNSVKENYFTARREKPELNPKNEKNEKTVVVGDDIVTENIQVASLNNIPKTNIYKEVKKNSEEKIEILNTYLNPLKINSIPVNYSVELAQFQFTKIEKQENQIDENSTFVAVNEMKNPIPFVTREINTRFNTNLDIRTAKASKKKQGGFYFKLGKLEISRKITPVQEELASF
ncbi:MAG: hypothetical protein ACK5B9_12240 [Flavobacteriia bacterium]|jgi:hypothetical protein